jgi:hypothetical protein
LERKQGKETTLSKTRQGENPIEKTSQRDNHAKKTIKEESPKPNPGRQPCRENKTER